MVRSVLPFAAAWAVASTALATSDSGGELFDCVIEPRQVIELRAPIEGLIQRIYVDRGDAVTEGQVLVELNATVERASADLAKFRSEMQSATRSAESRLEFATRKLARKQDLYNQGFVSAQERDEALAEHRVTEAALLEAVETRRLAELEHERATEQMRLHTLRSPVNGVVMERTMHPGEVSEMGTGRRAILKIAEVDVLYIEVLLPSNLYPALKVGMPAEVMPEPPLAGAYRAKLKVVDRVLDAASGTFGVRLEMENPGRKLPAGVRCKARFPALPRGMPHSGVTKTMPANPMPGREPPASSSNASGKLPRPER
jgi:RND family efflux transporter MFP subunit